MVFVCYSKDQLTEFEDIEDVNEVIECCDVLSVMLERCLSDGC